MRGEIVAFDEKHVEPAARGVTGNARAVDAAADDEKVAGLLIAHRKATSLPDGVRLTASFIERDAP
jgi:hypothetical protein